MSLATCTGMDVISLIKKKDFPFSSFTVTTVGDPKEEHPRVFSELEMIYDIEGEKVDQEWFQECVRKSVSKYSPIVAMLKKSVPLFYTVRINGEIEARKEIL